jgi:hypothetical protein
MLSYPLHGVRDIFGIEKSPPSTFVLFEYESGTAITSEEAERWLGVGMIGYAEGEMRRSAWLALWKYRAH